MAKVTNCSGSGAQLHGFKSQLYMIFDESLDFSVPQFFREMKTRIRAGLTLHDSVTMV